MRGKQPKGLMKHFDFILIDFVCLQLSFILGFLLVHGYGNPYGTDEYKYQALVLVISQLLVTFFANNYGGILRRKKFDEMMAVIQYMLKILVLALAYLFMVKHSETASRLQFGTTSVIFVVISFCARMLNKKIIAHYSSSKNVIRSIVLVTGKDSVREAVRRLYHPDMYQDYFISHIILLDSEPGSDFSDLGIEIFANDNKAIDMLKSRWVDEVFILQPENQPFPSALVESITKMGITVSYTVTSISDGRWPVTEIRRIGPFKVLTNSMLYATPGQLFVKRLMDVVGGFVGCIFTGIVFIFVAPLIYMKSPGPIFFTQVRIGQNGKPFTMHKFRTMYPDAEKRKAELMSQNNVKDGMMFKMDDDPRIIGSEKKDKNGRPKGIGNFLRNTSLDEFPQFYDVLIGKMSLVGWRPCTTQEWKKYMDRHRIRAAMKPGMTGMWQVSGRSEITDFDEVVNLDREYLETWSLGLDVKLILKTIVVLITRRGAK